MVIMETHTRLLTILKIKHNNFLQITPCKSCNVIQQLPSFDDSQTLYALNINV